MLDDYQEPPEPTDEEIAEARSRASDCSPTFFIRGVFIRKCFALMRQRLKNEPFERQEFLGAWLDATEAEIFEENGALSSGGKAPTK